jgi:hypothetical protein
MVRSIHNLLNLETVDFHQWLSDVYEKFASSKTGVVFFAFSAFILLVQKINFYYKILLSMISLLQLVCGADAGVNKFLSRV